MLSSNIRQGVWRKNKSRDAQETETIIKRGRFPILKGRTRVSVSEREGDKDDVPVQQQRRRSIAWTMVRRVVSTLKL